MLLDHNQRLNINALLGLLDCPNMRDTRLVWDLMDRMELSNDEKARIEYTTDKDGIPGWNMTRIPPAQPMEVSDPEIRQIQRALDLFLKHFKKIPVRSRSWLEPLLRQLPVEWVDALF